jgi:stress responsive alpha/beta barrel protein
MKPIKTLVITLSMLAVFSAGVLVGQKKNSFKTPSSVLHVITVKWNDGATDAQKQAALDGVKTMAAQVPGLANVWLKTLKVQPQGYGAVIAMEFTNQAAFDAYAANPAHKEWEKVYLPVRQQSTTHDVTN